MTGGAKDTAVFQETFAYDVAGRLCRSTEGDGTVKFMLYDKAGNATLMMSSTGTDLAATPRRRGRAAITNSGANASARSRRDRRGVDQRLFEARPAHRNLQPYRQLRYNGSRLRHDPDQGLRTYNAFGEVLTEWIRAAIWQRVNLQDRLLLQCDGPADQEKEPGISWTSEAGATAAARPTEHYSYDRRRPAGRRQGRQ